MLAAVLGVAALLVTLGAAFTIWVRGLDFGDGRPPPTMTELWPALTTGVTAGLVAAVAARVIGRAPAGWTVAIALLPALLCGVAVLTTL